MAQAEINALNVGKSAGDILAQFEALLGAGLRKEFGNLRDPLIEIPMRRANDAIRLSGAESFTRASVAWYRDPLTDVLTQAGVDTPCHERCADGVTRRRFEPAATNGIRNNTMQGAVAGAPGTLPTNWSVGWAGITREVVSVGVEDGIEYIDLRFTGVPGAIGDIFFEQNQIIAAAMGEKWVGTVFCLQVGGSTTNIANINLRVLVRDSGGSWVSSSGSVFAPGNVATLRDARRVTLLSIAEANAAYVRPQLEINIINSVDPIDITLRVGLPQLEKTAYATSPIKTSGSAVTRAADTMLLPVAGNLPRVNSPLAIIATVQMIGNDVAVYQDVFNVTGRWACRLIAARVVDSYPSAAMGASGNQAAGTQATPVGTPKRLGARRTASGVDLWVDAVKIGTVALSDAAGTGSAITIGAGGGMYLSNMRVFERELTDLEMALA